MDETLRDLCDDYTEFLALSSSALDRIDGYQKKLVRQQGHHTASAYALVSAGVRNLEASYAHLHKEISAELDKKAQWSSADIERLIECKKTWFGVLRVLQSSLGSVLTAGNWQSPSFAHASHSQAGNETGEIFASKNDYKRDAHADEAEYAKIFADAYIDAGLHMPPEACLTSSGMAAVTVALLYCRERMQAGEIVLVGKSTYFQNKRMLEMLFPGKLLYFDETNIEEMAGLVGAHKPAAVFFDSLSNTASLVLPDMHAMLSRLNSLLSKRSVIIVDNTTLATTCQPLHEMPIRISGPRLIVVESLLKYHQFGFDRVNGGILWTGPGAAADLRRIRMDSGTIISDTAVQTLPLPNRALLEARLARIWRNAAVLAQRLTDAIENQDTPIVQVIYPGAGGCVVLVFKPGYEDIKLYDGYIQRVLDAASKEGVDVVGGASFGFTTTRIYAVARYAGSNDTPFVRVAVGTETMYELEALVKIFF